MTKPPLSYRAFNMKTQQWVDALADSPQAALALLAPLAARNADTPLTLANLQVMENGTWVWVI